MIVADRSFERQRLLGDLATFSSGMPSFSANSSGVGSRLVGAILDVGRWQELGLVRARRIDADQVAQRQVAALTSDPQTVITRGSPSAYPCGYRCKSNILGCWGRLTLSLVGGGIMEIEFFGKDSDSLVSDFHVWLRNERLSGVSFDRKRGPPLPDTMGGEYLPIIIAMMASPAIVEIIKSLQTWIQTRRPKIKVILRLPDGSSIELETDNVSSVSAQLEDAANRLQSMKS